MLEVVLLGLMMVLVVLFTLWWPGHHHLGWINEYLGFLLGWVGHVALCCENGRQRWNGGGVGYVVIP
jgi:hypothetical protein